MSFGAVFIVLAGTLTARIAVECIAARYLMNRRGFVFERMVRALLITNVIGYPVAFLTTCIAFDRQWWSFFVMTPLFELAFAGYKSFVIAQSLPKYSRDPLRAIFTGCFANAVSLMVAIALSGAIELLFFG